MDRVRRRHTHTAFAVVLLVRVVIGQRNGRTICPARHLQVRLRQLDLLLKQLVVEIILDGKILCQQVNNAFGREHVVQVLRQRQFGLYRYIQQDLEAVGRQFDTAFLSVNRVLHRVHPHADLVRCRLLGRSGLYRILRDLLEFLDIDQARIQEGRDTLQRQHGYISTHYATAQLALALLQGDLFHIDRDVIEQHAYDALTVDTHRCRYTQRTYVRHVDLRIQTSH